MATNKVYERGTPLQLVSPSTITSNAPAVLRGTTGQSYGGRATGLAMIANEDYQSSTTRVSYDLEGCFALSVLAETGESPAVNSTVIPGDIIYANINSGTFDATSGIFSGFTLDKNQSGIPFGTVVQGTVTGGATGTVVVRLKEGL